MNSKVLCGRKELFAGLDILPTPHKLAIGRFDLPFVINFDHMPVFWRYNIKPYTHTYQIPFRIKESSDYIELMKREKKDRLSERVIKSFKSQNMRIREIHESEFEHIKKILCDHRENCVKKKVFDHPIKLEFSEWFEQTHTQKIKLFFECLEKYGTYQVKHDGKPMNQVKALFKKKKRYDIKQQKLVFCIGDKNKFT